MKNFEMMAKPYYQLFQTAVVSLVSEMLHMFSFTFKIFLFSIVKKINWEDIFFVCVSD